MVGAQDKHVIEWGTVAAVTGEGLDVLIQRPDGTARRGKVPASDIFLGHAHPVMLSGLAYVDHVTVAVNDRIPLLPRDSQHGTYSRRDAVLQAAAAAAEKTDQPEVSAATITDIGLDEIHAVADSGAEVTLPRSATERMLSEAVKQRRLRPDRQPELEWLYPRDRIKVRIGSLLRPGCCAGSIVVGETSPEPSDARQFSSVSPPRAPKTRFSHVLILHDQPATLETTVVPYFRASDYVVNCISDLAHLQPWLDQYTVAQRDAPATSRDLLALVQLEATHFPWESACEQIAKATSGSALLLMCGAETDFNRRFRRRVESCRDRFHVLTVWSDQFSVVTLGSVLMSRSIHSDYMAPDPDKPSSTVLSPSQAGAHTLAVAEYGTFVEDCRRALDGLVHAAGQIAKPCVAMLFGIHPLSHEVGIEASAGDSTIILEFQKRRADLFKSPIRDLGVYGHSADTGDAAKQEGRYRWFLNCVGGYDKPLSVAGLRLSTPPGGANDHVVFLLSKVRDAFANRDVVRKELLAAQRVIELALWARRLQEQSRRMQTLAETGANSQHFCHEAKRCIEQANRRISRHGGQEGAATTQRFVRDRLNKAEELLCQLLQTTTDEPLDFRPREAAHNVIRACRDPKNPAIRLAVTGTCDRMVRVHGRQLPFECVLANLVTNAMQQIVECGAGEGLVTIDVSLNPGGKQLMALVRDNGPGIHRKYWESVFEAGVSTRQQGSGLGLAVCRRLARETSGTLELRDSVLYSGTEFGFMLPVVPLQPTAGASGKGP